LFHGRRPSSTPVLKTVSFFSLPEPSGIQIRVLRRSFRLERNYKRSIGVGTPNRADTSGLLRNLNSYCKALTGIQCGERRVLQAGSLFIPEFEIVSFNGVRGEIFSGGNTQQEAAALRRTKLRERRRASTRQKTIEEQ
jgi:hypothetical protein